MNKSVTLAHKNTLHDPQKNIKNHRVLLNSSPIGKPVAVNSLKPKLCDDNGHWMGDYVRLRFSATKQIRTVKQACQPRLYTLI